MYSFIRGRNAYIFYLNTSRHNAYLNIPLLIQYSIYSISGFICHILSITLLLLIRDIYGGMCRYHSLGRKQITKESSRFTWNVPFVCLCSDSLKWFKPHLHYQIEARANSRYLTSIEYKIRIQKYHPMFYVCCCIQNPVMILQFPGAPFISMVKFNHNMDE